MAWDKGDAYQAADWIKNYADTVMAALDEAEAEIDLLLDENEKLKHRIEELEAER